MLDFDEISTIRHVTALPFVPRHYFGSPTHLPTSQFLLAVYVAPEGQHIKSPGDVRVEPFRSVYSGCP